MNKLILLSAIVLVSFQNSPCQDTINANWKWNKDIESYVLRPRDVLIEPLIINDIIFFNGSLYPYNITNGKVLKYEEENSLKLIKENCRDSLVLFNENYMVFLVNIYNGKILLELSRKIGLKYPLITQPKIVNRGYCAFQKNDTAIVCYDYIKGTERWNYSIPRGKKEFLYMEPLQVNDTVIIATGKKIICCDANSGKPLFEIPLNSRLSGNMLVSDTDLYYVTAEDDCVHAFSMTKKKETWKFACVEDSKDFCGGGMSCKIFIQNDVLYFANGILAAMNKNSGEIIWKNSSSCISFLYTSQCIFTNKFIITSERADDEYPLACFDKTTGKKIGYSFGVALFGESNTYSPKHNLFININRKEGVSMKVNAWQLTND